MAFYVYILQSEKDGSFYKGFTENYTQRLIDHNAGFSKFTRQKLPWKLVYVEVHHTKREALIREKKLKRCNSDYLKWLVDQNTNILNT